MFKLRIAALAALIPVAAIALTACGGSDPAPATTVAPSVAPTTSLVATSETNVCPGDVVTLHNFDELDCDVAPPQQLNWQMWTDPKYGFMTPEAFADECSDAGGILDPVSVEFDTWLCSDIDY